MSFSMYFPLIMFNFLGLLMLATPLLFVDVMNKSSNENLMFWRQRLSEPLSNRDRPVLMNTDFINELHI